MARTYEIRARLRTLRAKRARCTADELGTAALLDAQIETLSARLGLFERTPTEIPTETTQRSPERSQTEADAS